MKRAGVGKFVLGWVMGFIFTLLLIAGLGFWVYKSGTIKIAEKLTGAEITNNKTVETKTIEDWIKIATKLTKTGTSAYTIAKFEDEFDVKLIDDSIYGISLDKIRNSPIKNIKSAFEDTVNTATFNNVLSIINTSGNLGLLDTILEKEVVYYVQDNILYKNNEFVDNNVVDFEYRIADGVLSFGENSATIITQGDKQIVKILFKHIPMNTALSTISDVTKNLKIYEVMNYTREGDEGNYSYKNNGQPVSSIMASLAEHTVEELSNSSAFDDLYVYDVLGYIKLDDEFYNDGVKVSGVLSVLAPSSIGGLSNTINNMTLGQALDIDKTSAHGVVKALYDTKITELSNKIEVLKIYEILGYYENSGKYYKTFDGTNYSNQVTGVMGAIAGSTINNLDSAVEGLLVKDVFDSDTKILNLFTTEELNSLKVIDMPDEVLEKMNTATIEYLVNNEIITVEITNPTYYNSIKHLTISKLINGG